MEFIRLRRLRNNQVIRDLFAQTQILPKDLIMPYFVIEGRNKKEPIKYMPDIFRHSVDNLIKDIGQAKDLGIKATLVFGIPLKKDNLASQAYQKNGIVQRAVEAIKKNIKDMVVITDVCLCGYTLHGHCGVGEKSKIQSKIQDFYINNDETLKILTKISLSHAQAGADFVAPSAMMDGQVRMIRETLDRNGFKDTGILAYSAKYASNFYGPFREALNSAPQLGDRKTYQMDYRNALEALKETEQDIKEGADIIMVKPALAYLDIIRRVKEISNIPVAAYNVSGEYSLVKLGIDKGLFKGKDIILENLISMKRSGADVIITYHAKEVAKWLKT